MRALSFFVALPLALASLLTVTPPASAKAAKGVKAHSIGAPNHGKLEGGSRLHGSKHLKVRSGANPYGLHQLTHALKSAADRVGSKYAGSVLLVGDLSAKEGGPLTGHNSHQTGRDADVGFYVMNANGKALPTKHFVAFDRNGVGKELTNVHFDDARNWFFVESLLKNEKANVHYVFVATSLKVRLLAYANKHHVSKELLARASAAMMAPQETGPHDDHFHVRVSCPDDMKDCIEESIVRAPPADEPAPVAQGG
jgi:penicillin-insensitive murein DD-endopeptidase